MLLRETSLAVRLRRIRTLRRAVRAGRWLGQVARIRWQACRARLIPDDFDRAYGVQTRVAMSLVDLYRTTRRGGHEYEPTAADRFCRLIAALPVPLEDMIFVDYGSGAGRVVLLASEFPFKEIIGIELSPRLLQLAHANVQAFEGTSRRHASIRLIHGDATTFELPPDTAVLYFYNPFGLRTMRAVLRGIEVSLNRSPRRLILIAYCCDYDTRMLIERSPLFEVIVAERDVRIFRNVSSRAAQQTGPVSSGTAVIVRQAYSTWNEREH